MNSQKQVHSSENREVGGLSQVRNGSVSERIKAFNGLAKESNLSGIIQSKSGNHGDVVPHKNSELMKLGDLENASSHTLFRVMTRILDDSIEKNNEDIPQHVASVLKLLVQEIEHRVSEQKDSIQKQSNLYKSREDRYHSKIKALETIAAQTAAENEVIKNQLQQIKIEKSEIEGEKKLEEYDLIKLRKEKESCESRILSLNEELMSTKKSYEDNLERLEAEAEETKDKLQKKVQELESLLTNSRKGGGQECKILIDSQLGSLQELRMASEFIKQEVLRIKNIYDREFNHLGLNLRRLMDGAENYHNVLEENRKLHNEIQDLKGNIRVYCRVRPLLSGQCERQKTIQYPGENRELIVINPSKPGKENHRIFKFNKVFGPAATQEEVFQDVRPLIRSVLDGYNVCIFAYGQTGSGKTYTMNGPNAIPIVDWGVNYRALNDLFNISQKKCSTIVYEIIVQMIETYNEQVHDLLRNDGFHKRLGTRSTSKLNGLDVPDASLHPVNSITDVLELMNIGLAARAVGATALNQKSSRSHSILIVHVRRTDLKTSAISRGCLHLVDLAGSERVNRSEAAGHKLQEAQHINRSVAALGDVIYALAQNSPHVPYRNSKLTQVLQSSLGSQAKILVLVQLNPDAESYSETLNTLKFAERIAGIELGSTGANESQSVKELMEQVASLKDALAEKDKEIKRSRMLKKTVINERNGMGSPKYGSLSPVRHSNGAAKRSQRIIERRSLTQKAAFSVDNKSNYSDKHSDTGSHQSSDDFKPHKDLLQQSRLAIGPEKFSRDIELKFDPTDTEDDIELLGLGDPDTEERLSDISDGFLSMGTDADGSINSIIEYTLFPETANTAEEITERIAD